MLILLLAMLPALAEAEPAAKPKSGTATTSAKTFVPKKTTRATPCAEYGAGFVKVEGSDTCVKIGGFIDIGGGVAIGGR